MDKSIFQLNEDVCLDDFLSVLSRGRDLFAMARGESGQFHLVRAEIWRPSEHELGCVSSG